MLVVKCCSIYINFSFCCHGVCLIFGHFSFSSSSIIDRLLPAQQYHGPCPVLCDIFQVREPNIYITYTHLVICFSSSKHSAVKRHYPELDPPPLHFPVLPLRAYWATWARWTSPFYRSTYKSFLCLEGFFFFFFSSGKWMPAAFE